MLLGCRRELNLFATGVFSVCQADPAFVPHGFEARVNCCRGAQLVIRHHVTHAQALFLRAGMGNQIENAFFKGVQIWQGGKAANGVGKLQKSKVNV